MPDFETAPAELVADSPVATAAVVDTAPASKFDVVIDLWFAECVQNTEVGHYVGAYNAIHAAKEELKRRLAQEI